MNLLWPGFLILLALVPLTAGLYLWILRRRRRYAVRFSSLSLVRDALPRRLNLRRHLPFVLFLLALSSLAVAAARPVTIVQVPIDRTTIILALDVSRSMLQADIPPSRLDAAKSAALAFVERQKPGSRIGVVGFFGYAELIQPPTSDRDALRSAITRLTTGRRTAIGSGILESIDAIAEIDPSVAPSNGDIPVTGDGFDQAAAYVPSIIVLLTDGVSNSGPDPLDAADQAAGRGVRVYTIGFGTAEGSEMFGRQPEQGGMFGNDPFGNNSQPFGGWFRRGIDEATLRDIADMTGGEYYQAASASELNQVFENLPTYLITRPETMEISVAFAAVGALLVGLAIVLSLLWHPLT